MIECVCVCVCVCERERERERGRERERDRTVTQQGERECPTSEFDPTIGTETRRGRFYSATFFPAETTIRPKQNV